MVYSLAIISLSLLQTWNYTKQTHIFLFIELPALPLHISLILPCGIILSELLQKIYGQKEARSPVVNPFQQNNVRLQYSSWHFRYFAFPNTPPLFIIGKMSVKLYCPFCDSLPSGKIVLSSPPKVFKAPCPWVCKFRKIHLRQDVFNRVSGFFSFMVLFASVVDPAPP